MPKELKNKSDKLRVKVYIDGANVFYSQKKMGWVLDWIKVRDYLKVIYDVIEFRYYTGLKNNDGKMAKYLKYLDANGIFVITKPLKEIKIGCDHPMAKLHDYNKIFKCNFDVEIATDILLDKLNVDGVVLFSGDSDFDYLVRKLRDFGNRIMVYASKKTLSWELKLSSRDYCYFEDIKNSISRK